jgi:hypothetical protein
MAVAVWKLLGFVALACGLLSIRRELPANPSQSAPPRR